MRKLFLRPAVAIAVAALLTPANPVMASTATAPVLISATVVNFCGIVALPLPFGNYTSNVINLTTTVTLTCTAGTAYNVGLDAGTGSGATVAVRKMTNILAGTTLGYTLYSNSAETTVWGNTIGTNTITGTGTGLPQPVTAYGQVFASQFAAPGAYLDTVTATITY